MKTKELTGEVSNGFSDFQKRVSEKARHVGEVTDRYVHDNAWSSIAFAALIGCVVGFLMGRRGD